MDTFLVLGKKQQNIVFWNYILVQESKGVYPAPWYTLANVPLMSRSLKKIRKSNSTPHYFANQFRIYYNSSSVDDSG